MIPSILCYAWSVEFFGSTTSQFSSQNPRHTQFSHQIDAGVTEYNTIQLNIARFNKTGLARVPGML